MKKRLLRLKSMLLLPMLFLLLMAMSNNGKAQTVKTDKLDYAPGDPVIITGTGWHANEEVSLMVMNLTYDGLNMLPHYGEWFVTADSNGDISSWWDVTIDELNTELVLTALGQSSGYKEQVFFTDAPSLSSISTNTGPTTGGNTVTLTGNGFVDGATFTVTFGTLSVEGTRPAGNDNKHLTAIVPAQSAGTVNVTVTVSASNSGSSGTTGSVPYTYNKVDQTITFDAPTDKTYGDTPFSLAATASSGLPVSYSIVSGPATISGNTLTIIGAGEVTVRATQAGNTTYNAAENVDQSFTVTKAPLVVTADAQTKVYGSANPTPLTATISGFVLGQTLATSGVTGTADVTTLADVNSPVNSYTLTAALGSLASANYSFSFVNGSLAVTKAPLVVTADAQTKVYGSANPTPLTATISGFVLGQTLATSGVTGTADVTTLADVNSPVNSYTLTAALGSLASANYSFSFVNGSLAVTKAPLVVTADAQTKVYGSANPTPLTATISGFVLGQTLATSGVTGTADVTTLADVNSPVNSYTLTAALGSLASANYSFSFVNGSLAVTKAPLVVTADAQTKVYGSANPTPLTATISGFVLGQTLATSGVTGTADVTTLADVNSPVNSYTLTAALGSLASANYSFSFVNGSLAVTKAPLVVTADAQTKVYGSANPTPLTATISGFVLGQTLATSGVTGTADVTTLADVNSPVNSYTLTAALGSLASANYSFSFVNGSLAVTKAPLVVTADAQTKVYGSANPTPLTATISGFVLGQTLATSGVTGTADVTTLADVNSPVNSYTLTAALGSLASANYSFSFVNGSLAVTKAPLVVTADAQTKVYGSANPTPLTATISGFVLGQTLATSGVTGTADVTTLADVNSPVNSYTLTAALGSLASANYSFSFVNGSLAVTKAPLVVTADAQTKVYGSANPTPLTATISGFVLGQTLATSGVTGTADVTTLADVNSPVNSYTLTAALGSLASANYSFSFVNGSLAVTKAPLVVTADAQTKVYGSANPTPLTATISGFVLGQTLATSGVTGTADVTTLADVNSPVNSYTLTAALGSLASANYSFSFVNGSLAVTKAPLVVTADAQTKVYGSANPTPLTATISGFVLGQTLATSGVTGTADVTTLADVNSPVNSYTLTAALGSLASANYSFSFVNGSLAVTKAPLVVTADAQTKVYGSANPTPLTATISGFVLGQTLATSGVTGTADVTTLADVNSPVNSYTLTAALGSLASANYSFSFVNGSLAVTKAPLVVTADAQTKVYGSANPTPLTATISGFVLGQTLATSGVTGTADVTTLADVNSPVNSYTLTAALGSLASANYSFSFVNGSLAVTKAPLVVTADAQTKVYGSANPTPLTATISGFVLGQTLATSGVTGTADVTTLADVNSPVNSYTLTAALGSLASANYSFSFVNGSLAVTKAPLVVTADAQTKVYGSANPTPLTATISGFVLGQTLATSGVTGTADVTTLADVNSPVNSYTLTAALGSLASANYSFSFVNGSLAVTKAPLVVTADAQTKVYGSANPTPLTATISGFVLGQTLATSGVTGTADVTTLADVNSPVNSYTLTAALGSLASANYSFSFVNGSLAVTKAPLVVTADAQTKVYGSANPTPLTATISGFVLGQTLATSGVTGTADVTTLADVNSPVNSYTPYGCTWIAGFCKL